VISQSIPPKTRRNKQNIKLILKWFIKRDKY
jgi:hypothetical protein